jgi:VanZ family protein
MWQTFISVFPLALASAISVTSILLFLAILVAGENQARNGFAFILGGLLSLAAIAFIVVFPFTKADSGSSPNYTLHAVFDFALAFVCVIMVIRTWLNRHKTKPEKQIKKSGGFLEYFAIGLVIGLVSANTLPPYIGAVKDISGAKLAIVGDVVLCILIILISMSTILLPYLLFIFNKEAARKIIEPVNVFLKKNKNIINNTLLIVVAVYLCYHGLIRLNHII